MSSGITILATTPIFEVVIDRPKANAIDARTSRHLGEIFSQFRDDDAARVAVVTGAGTRFFSAGWDLAAAADGEAYDADFGIGGFGGYAELDELNKPVIAAVNGIAAGGGFEMVLAADLAVAADHAEFLLPEVSVGVAPDVGSILLPRRLPRAVAMEMLVAGKRLSATEAAGLGLVNAVVPGDELMVTARALAGRICDAAPLAVAAILEISRQTEHLATRDAYKHLRRGDSPAYRRMASSHDAREGPQAFSEGREPRWEGR